MLFFQRKEYCVSILADLRSTELLKGSIFGIFKDNNSYSWSTNIQHSIPIISSLIKIPHTHKIQYYKYMFFSWEKICPTMCLLCTHAWSQIPVLYNIFGKMCNMYIVKFWFICVVLLGTFGITQYIFRKT